MFYAYVGFIGDQFFFLSTDSTYSRVPGDNVGPFFFRRFFFGAHFMYKLVYYNLYYVSNFTQNRPIFTRIECSKFVCNEFVLVYVQIDLIQFEHFNLY